MGSLLVHLTHGPEAPTRAALAVLVAKAASDDGHDVALFLAGDATSLLREATADAVQGVGTGNFGENLRALAAEGVRIYASGMSAKARGLSPDQAVVAIQPAMPAKLVELTMSSDRVLTY
jgi:uncharacterized protein